MMKNNVLKLIVFSGLLLSPLTNSFAGENGGGGNGVGSSVEQVNSAIVYFPYYMFSQLEEHFEADKVFGTVDMTKLNSELHRVYKKIFLSTDAEGVSNIGSYFGRNKSKNIKPQTASCIHDSIEKDSSTLMKMNSDICVSISRLQRYEPDRLLDILGPLYIHEVSHQFGFNETSGDVLQNYIAFRFKLNRAVVLSDYINQSIKALKQGDGKTDRAKITIVGYAGEMAAELRKTYSGFMKMDSTVLTREEFKRLNDVIGGSELKYGSVDAWLVLGYLQEGYMASSTWSESMEKIQLLNKLIFKNLKQLVEKRINEL